MILNGEPLVPQIQPRENMNNSLSKVNFSLIPIQKEDNPIHIGEGKGSLRENRNEHILVGFPSTMENIDKEKKEEERVIEGEREICQKSHSQTESESNPMDSDLSEELAVLSTKPCDEPDRGKIKYICQNGHESETSTFCSVCHERIVSSYG